MEQVTHCPDDATVPCSVMEGANQHFVCPVHKTRLDARRLRQCQTIPEYREAFKAGRGPGQGGVVPAQHRKGREGQRAGQVDGRRSDRPKGLGDMVEQALSMVGITEERVTRFLGRSCGGCAKRKAALNRLGAWAKRVITGETEVGEKELDEIVGSD